MKTLIFTVGVLLLVSAAFAQTDRGTITGTVLDPTGAVIASATIEAKNTGDQRNVQRRHYRYGQLHALQSSRRHV